MIQLRQVSKYVYDVFSGTGFDEWSRVRKHHWGVVHIAGAAVNRVQAKQLLDVIEKHPHGSLEAIAIN